MSSELKIKNITLKNLQNAEHFELMSEVRSSIKACDPTKLDVASEYPVFEIAFDDEDKSFKIVSKSALTRSIEEEDRNRDALVKGMFAHVKSLSTHYDKKTVDAAYRIAVLCDSYGNLARESYDRETAGINNLLQDLAGEKYAEDVNIINLKEWTARLEKANKAFEAVMNQRYSEQSKKDELTRLRAARLATDDAYRAIRNKINAGIVFNGEEKYKAFVMELNARIDRFNDTLATRKGRADAKKSEQENGEASK